MSCFTVEVQFTLLHQEHPGLDQSPEYHPELAGVSPPMCLSSVDLSRCSNVNPGSASERWRTTRARPKVIIWKNIKELTRQYAWRVDQVVSRLNLIFYSNTMMSYLCIRTGGAHQKQPPQRGYSAN
jgi:hypothetical protein